MTIVEKQDNSILIITDIIAIDFSLSLKLYSRTPKIPKIVGFDVMKIKKFFTFTALFLSLYASGHNDTEKFYSKSFLRNYDAVNKSLKEIGFEDISFETSDGLTLRGLFLARPNATCNAIICAGWLPGKKEGMATFYALLPEYCNILLFDARGRGASDGSLLWKIWRYGMDEYKDVLGAISWINHNNELPIIIGGTCSGVFNAAHAILKLIQTNTIAQSRVKGLFFDSGWGSVMTMSQSSAIINIKKSIGKVVKLLQGTKQNLKNSILYQLCSSAAIYCFKAAHTVCARPLIMQYEKATNLFDKINQITVPILFVHSYDDTHADFSNANRLATLAPNKQCWWINESSHARHHLIHKELYKEKLIAFIDKALQQ